MKGEGNQQDYGMRIYDTRLGRFLSVDPLTKEYPWYTPYQFAGNKPIEAIDLDGAEEFYINQQSKLKDKAQLQFKRDDEVKAEAALKQKYPLFFSPLNFGSTKEQPSFFSPEGARSAAAMETYQRNLRYAQPFDWGRTWDNVKGVAKDFIEAPFKEYYEMNRSFDKGDVFEGMYHGFKAALYAAPYGGPLFKLGRVGRMGAIVEGGAYDGVRAASKFLQESGVPRTYRKQILESFDLETISLKTADNQTFGLRFYGGEARETGRYLFPTFTDYTNRVGLALPPKWNSMTGFSQFQVSEGSTYIMGRASSQGGRFVGGSQQMYINDLKNLKKVN